jgi:hypothetical protein
MAVVALDPARCCCDGVENGVSSMVNSWQTSDNADLPDLIILIGPKSVYLSTFPFVSLFFAHRPAVVLLEMARIADRSHERVT